MNIQIQSVDKDDPGSLGNHRIISDYLYCDFSIIFQNNFTNL